MKRKDFIKISREAEKLYFETVEKPISVSDQLLGIP